MSSDQASIFKANLRRLLRREWLSQRQAAEQIGVDYKWFRRLCHQGLHRPDRRTAVGLEKVATHFDLTVSALWDDELPKRLEGNGGSVLIKWTGSKRLQAKQIVRRFPRRIGTYYEPFIGGGSVLYELLSSDIQCDRVKCSDICRPLIELWKVVKNEPRHLIEAYDRLWRELQDDGAACYLKTREKFNETGNPCLFFFLLRTCRNGLVRFNQRGQFTANLHHGRSGMRPENVKAVVEDWSQKLREHDVRFYARDYRRIQSIDDDLLYLDPPYRVNHRHPFYSGMIDFEMFFRWLRRQHGDYLLSLNGLRGGEDWSVDVPQDLYDEHIFVDAGKSSLAQLNGNIGGDLEDSLYVRMKSEVVGRKPEE
ncbi:MAG: Dam family site-specific DNA-(adenine-N6)-methyltransferase [Planctomycetaceae bacterium]